MTEASHKAKQHHEAEVDDTPMEFAEPTPSEKVEKAFLNHNMLDPELILAALHDLEGRVAKLESR